MYANCEHASVEVCEMMLYSCGSNEENRGFWRAYHCLVRSRPKLIGFHLISLRSRPYPTVQDSKLCGAVDHIRKARSRCSLSHYEMHGWWHVGHRRSIHIIKHNMYGTNWFKVTSNHENMKIHTWNFLGKRPNFGSFIAMYYVANNSTNGQLARLSYLLPSSARCGKWSS